MKGKRVVLYSRVDGGGDPAMYQRPLSLQKDKLEEYAGNHGLRIVGCYEDAGYSGHDLSRPGLTQMLADWKNGKFDAVLIAKRTRLFRGSLWEEPKWPFPILSANYLDHVPYYEQKR